MFRLQPKVKERRKISIPPELRDSMREVFALIQEAKRDADVSLDYDDAIQIGPLCGGRYQKKPSRYEFRYYPESSRQRGTWYLDLHNSDIEDLADGRLADITLYCCTSPTCERKFNKADGHCDCDYVKDPDFDTFEFPAALEKLRQRGVDSIAADSTRDDVLATLGPPQKSGGDITQPPLSYIWPWIVYRRNDCQLRFEFDKQKRIRSVTVMERDWEPGK